MKRIKIILTLFLMIVWAVSYAQTVIDYRKAAEQGDAKAQALLGYCYANGDGVSQDYELAVYWYEKAAEQGIAEAQYNLGMLFYLGNKVVKEDNKLADFWLSKAVKNPNLKGNTRKLAEKIQTDIRGILDAESLSYALDIFSRSFLHEGREFVDLGLSVKWATCNMGTSTIDRPEKYGNYYAWGETHTKSNYDWSTYKWCNGRNTILTKYNADVSKGSLDNKKVLDLEDDIAHIHWGGYWRIPTKEEFVELISNCDCEAITINGVGGVKFISKKNGKSIFLPVAGNRDGTNLDDVEIGCYWSSSIINDNSDKAKILVFNSERLGLTDVDRYLGLSVRPVCTL